MERDFHVSYSTSFRSCFSIPTSAFAKVFNYRAKTQYAIYNAAFICYGLDLRIAPLRLTVVYGPVLS
jgi:hypothetical protein